MSCIFCKIINKEIPAEIVYEDEDFLAFLDINPISVCHTLLVPKKHSDYLFDMESKEYSKLLLKAKDLSRYIKEVSEAKKVGLAVEQLSVPHVHVHLIPVNKMNDLDPCKAKKANVSDLEDIKEKIASKILKGGI